MMRKRTAMRKLKISSKAVKFVAIYLATAISSSALLFSSPALAQQSGERVRNLPRLPSLPSLQSLPQANQSDVNRISDAARASQGGSPRLSLPGLNQQQNSSQGDEPKQNTRPTLQQVDSQSGIFGGKTLTPEEKHQRAFETLKERTLPLSPTEILELHQLLDKSQRAVATPANPPPTPVSSSLTVDLSPGVIPPVIRLSAGYISSLVMVDVTGAPWPIAGYGIGDPTTFNVQWDGNSHILHIQSLKSYATGNLVVRLVGQPTPVTITLVTGQRQVDYRADLRVLSRGPNAIANTIVNTQKGLVDSMLVHFLDGIPPEGSVKLNVAGDDAQAWQHSGKIYYRTKLTLLSPAWQRTLQSPDGTRVFELPQTPLLLATRDGKTIKIHLSGF